MGIDIKTVWLWRLKLIIATANIPMPILSGIIQVDETFVRESQKGSRHLKSMVAQTEERKSRYGRQSSKYCCVNNTPHFIRPSNFLKIIGNHGYIIQATDEFEKKANKKILEHLYYEGITDKITNRGEILFDKFNDIKYQNGLSLSCVNELHNDIKRFINRDMTNVSTKYLQDYIGYFTYIRNWRVEHGHSPTSKADAEAIFTEILKTKKNLTSVEVRQKELILPKPSSRYMEVLKEETEKARTAIDNPYFKFNEEDSIFSFNKREYLLDLPKSRLFEIAKDRSQLIAEEDLEVMKSSRYVSKIR